MNNRPTLSTGPYRGIHATPPEGPRRTEPLPGKKSLKKTFLLAIVVGGLLLALFLLGGCATDPEANREFIQQAQANSARQEAQQQQFYQQQMQQLTPPPAQPYYIPPIQQPIDVNVHNTYGGLPTSR